MERKQYLTSKAFKMFLGASILTALSAMLGNIVDGIIVSHLIDYNAMSATSICKPLFQGNYTFYQLIGLGASILVATAMGQNDHHRVNMLFSWTIVILLVFGLAEMLVGIICPDVIVSAMCKNADLHDYASQYFIPIIIGTPLFFAVYFLGGFVAIDGAPKLVSKAMLIDNIVNLVFDIVFIQFCGLSVLGSALATVLGHIVAVAMMCTHFLKGKSQYRFTLKGPGIFSGLKESCFTGLPFAVASICMTIYLYATQSLIGDELGKDALFIFSVMLNIMTIYNMFVTGACTTMQQLAAIQIGLGDHYGHRLTVFQAFNFLNISLGISWVVLLICPQIIAKLFHCPDALLSECCYGVRIYGLAFWLFCILYLLMVNYQLIKQKLLANVISYALSLTVIPVMWFNVVYAKELVWWSNLVAYVIVLLAVFLMSEIIRHRKSEIKKMPLLLMNRSTEYPSLDFSYDYTLESMHKGFDQLSAWLKEQNLSEHVIFKVRIIAEELMSNITRHSEQKNKNAFADVRLVVSPDVVTFALTDDGIPFDPIANKDKGYGLMIANGAASDINYQYKFGQNMTTVKVAINEE